MSVWLQPNIHWLLLYSTLCKWRKRQQAMQYNNVNGIYRILQVNTYIWSPYYGHIHLWCVCLYKSHYIRTCVHCRYEQVCMKSFHWKLLNECMHWLCSFHLFSFAFRCWIHFFKSIELRFFFACICYVSMLFHICIWIVGIFFEGFEIWNLAIVKIFQKRTYYMDFNF